MIEIKPQDIIIQTYPLHTQGGMHVARQDVGIKLYHKPSGIEISCERHRSQHKNKNECVIILQDLLTPFEECDIVYTNNGEGLIESINRVCVVAYEGYSKVQYLDHIGHTKEGYVYKTIKRKQAMIEDYQKDIDQLVKEIKELNNVK